jgi:transposase
VTKVELFEVIRRDRFINGKSVRAIAEERGVHRRVVRQALNDAVPPERKRPKRVALVLTAALRAVIDQWLKADRDAPRKQRHTARRIAARLQVEHGYLGAESTVRRLVATRRRELGFGTETFVPLVHDAGQEGEVDWYEAEVDFPQGREKVQFFAMRSCYSGRDFHMAFPRQTQQAFLEAHAAAFEHFGGVFGRMRYDNLSSAVKRVLRGRRRVETDRFVALRSHYLFGGEFCIPGKQGAHEKGGVEGGLGRFRRNHLVPVPTAADYASLNRWLLDECARNDHRKPEGKPETIGTAWQREKDLLLRHPAEPFDAAEVSMPRVDKMGRICVKTNRYSVPIRLAHRTVEARLHALRLEVRHEGKVVATPERQQGKHEEQLDLDHYLELLLDRPAALAQSRPLRQARDGGRWPEDYDRLWSALKERWGDAKGTRELVTVLMLHRDERGDLVHVAVGLALEYGCYDAGAICTLLRQLVTGERKVPPLTELGALAQYDRPALGLELYDQLLPLHANMEVH